MGTGTERSLIPISAQTGDFESWQGGAGVHAVRQQAVPSTAGFTYQLRAWCQAQPATCAIPGAPKPCLDICPAPACISRPLRRDGRRIALPGVAVQEEGRRRGRAAAQAEAVRQHTGSPFKPGSILVAALLFPPRLMSWFSKLEAESHGSF